MGAGGHGDDAGPLPLGQLESEVPHATGSAVDEHRALAVEFPRAVLGLLERRGMIVPELDQELPRRQPRHDQGGGVHVVDASQLAGEVGCRRGDVLGVSAALENGGEAQKADHLISDREAVDVGGDGFHDA